MRNRIALTLLVCAVICDAAISAPPKVRVTGMFSDLAYVAEAGDLVGTEVFLGYQGDGIYFALVQCAEGSPSKPLLVEASVDGLQVKFSLPPSDSSHCPVATFVGTVSRSGLRGKFLGGGEAVTLRRRSSYWQ